MRNIADILLFRGDLSPFLAHLTRANEGADAKAQLHEIFAHRTLRAGPTMSDARFFVGLNASGNS